MTTNNTNANVNTAAGEEMMGKFQQTQALAGQCYDYFREGINTVNVEASRVRQDIDQHLETLKGGLFAIGTFIGDIVGFTALQASVNQILDAGCSAGSENSMMAMAEEVRRQVAKKIDNLNRRGDVDSLAKAACLKEIIGDDGQPIEKQGILGACVSGLVWASKRIAGLMKKWFGVNENSPKVLKFICGAVGAVWNFIRSGVKVIISVVGTVLSYAVAGIIKLANWIIQTAKVLFARAKAFAGKYIPTGKGNAGNEQQIFEQTETEADAQ